MFELQVYNAAAEFAVESHVENKPQQEEVFVWRKNWQVTFSSQVWSTGISLPANSISLVIAPNRLHCGQVPRGCRQQPAERQAKCSNDSQSGSALDAFWELSLLAAQLCSSNFLETLLLNAELVLWWGEDSAWHAAEDRCPHKCARRLLLHANVPFN